MANKRIKVFVIIILFLSLSGLVFWYFYSKSQSSQDETTPTVDGDSTTSIHIYNNIPQNLEDLITEIASEGDYEIVETSADIYVGLDEDYPDFSIYQFLAPTKPWSQLATTPESTVFELSDYIDKDVIEEVDQDYFDFDYSSVTGVSLKTLNKLDSTTTSIPIDGKSIFHEDWWEEEIYPLTIEVSVWTDTENGELIIKNFRDEILKSAEFEEYGYTTEYPDPDDFVEIIKTGTTVAGGPGWELCERTKGDAAYPINEVKDVLENADITIISSESSFVEGCSQGAGTTAFCGKPKYLDNLLESGVDIVSLTGNHMNDYGRNYFTDTLESYTENNVLYFASGTNSIEAWKPLTVETEAGTISFVGYNRMGPDGMIATDTLTGTAYYDQDELLTALGSVTQASDIVWVDTHLWPEYGTTPSQDQISLSEEAIDNGATIVTGVSSHEVQGSTFYEESPVFYGLGNFWFDQMWSEETRTGIALRVWVYKNKIRNIEILPTKVYDYCQPRFLSGSEKQEILEYFVEISDF